jgi:hypothetical protein
MFKANTVFILRAGASWRYGYPTGEELVKRAKGAFLVGAKANGRRFPYRQPRGRFQQLS